MGFAAAGGYIVGVLLWALLVTVADGIFFILVLVTEPGKISGPEFTKLWWQWFASGMGRAGLTGALMAAGILGSSMAAGSLLRMRQLKVPRWPATLLGLGLGASLGACFGWFLGGQLTPGGEIFVPFAGLLIKLTWCVLSMFAGGVALAVCTFVALRQPRNGESA